MPHPSHRWGTTCVLRSNSWNGPPPAEGDMLRTPGGAWYLVDDVRHGTGIGHYRMAVTRIPPQELDELAVAVPEAFDLDVEHQRVFSFAWARR